MSGPDLKRCRGYGSALYAFKGYSAVIPHLQNVYGPEQENGVPVWFFGFKYTSGVFEYFSFATQEEAEVEHRKLLEAITAYWCDGPEPLL